jgi:hypothetical protein
MFWSYLGHENQYMMSEQGEIPLYMCIISLWTGSKEQAVYTLLQDEKISTGSSIAVFFSLVVMH